MNINLSNSLTRRTQLCHRRWG